MVARNRSHQLRPNTVSNPWNPKYDKGSGALDRRHILSVNYVYKLPFFAKSTGLVKSLAGGWEMAGTIIDETGVSPQPGPGHLAAYDPVGLGGGYTIRPNVSGKILSQDVQPVVQHQPVLLPSPSWLGGPNMGFGNAGKDAIVGPGRVNFTTSLYKSFAITERLHIELRFESFNTFNHTQWNGVNTSMPQWAGTNNFGQISSAWDARTLELGGKFVF